MYGWVGTVLKVDLSSGKITKEPLSEKLRRNYIGGRGINVRMLYDMIKPGTDGLSPENVLIFGTGPLTGTMIASGRMNATAMSPITGILGDANAGSHFSPELKFAGYDHVVFTGKADKPVYVWINDDKVEIRDARHLWGKLTDETEHIIKDELGDPNIQVTCIGPAGEKLVRLASIVVGVDGQGGKSGIGAVMGSKNLKAVAVRGTGGVKVAEPEVFKALAKAISERMAKTPNYFDLSTYGSPYLMRAKQIKGGNAMKNAQVTGPFPAYDEICAETITKKYCVKSKSCFGCMNHCRHFYEIKEGPYAGLKGIGVELATQAGAMLSGNSYAPAMYKAYELCNQYGLDQSECGQEIGAAIEWFEKGIITEKDTEGLKLDWGDYEAIVEMVHRIGKRQGVIGDLLAEGGVNAARKLGPEAMACISHSKGAMRTTGDLRYMTAYMFGEATSTRGSDHLRGSKSQFGAPGQYEGVPRAVYENQWICTLADSLEICKFHTVYLRMEINIKDMAELYSAATGLRADEDGMKLIADRIWNLERAFICREGITRKDDYLGPRYMNEPIHGGPFDGMRIDRKKWDKMLDEYYEINGWDVSTGIPTRARLEHLGLKDVADDLEVRGLMGKKVSKQKTRVAANKRPGRKAR